MGDKVRSQYAKLGRRIDALFPADSRVRGEIVIHHDHTAYGHLAIISPLRCFYMQERKRY